MTETIEIERETFEKLKAEAEHLDVEGPAEVIELAHQRAGPSLGFASEIGELEGYLTICPECRAWTRLPDCWDCGVSINRPDTDPPSAPEEIKMSSLVPSDGGPNRD